MFYLLSQKISAWIWTLNSHHRKVVFSAWSFRWNGEKGKWVFIVTNLDRAKFSLSDVLQAYRLGVSLILTAIAGHGLQYKRHDIDFSQTREGNDQTQV